MKKIILICMGILSAMLSYGYMRPWSPYMYAGPEVQEEEAEGSAYVPPDREFINSKYGEYIDNRETEFRPGQDATRLFWSYSQP
ncbi:hypothetical protein [Francisella sp. 19X1-34]|uniref:hypothetical protein n=1 Tax=Francisella sp. 19X1-34 TaxID=3087177 RepID=UPI002E2F4A72|nr:hypothetical protein [Francisella sp. 19X1-34]MED7789514.1 hypothetical protein [Francisella sp. 19X1-34]